MTPLQNEIVNGPLSAELAPFVASGSDNEVARILNEKRFGVVVGVRRNEFATFAAASGLRSAIQDHANNTASPLRSVALGLLDFLAASDNRMLGLSSASSQGMLHSWESVLPDSNLTAQLNALATQPMSRAEIEFGYEITIADVAKLRGL